MSLPPLPTWAADELYPAGSDPWSGQPTKVAPPAGVADGGHVPGDPSTAAAQYENFVKHALCAHVGAYAKHAALNWQEGVSASQDLLPVWVPAARRWYAIRDVATEAHNVMLLDRGGAIVESLYTSGNGGGFQGDIEGAQRAVGHPTLPYFVLSTGSTFVKFDVATLTRTFFALPSFTGALGDVIWTGSGWLQVCTLSNGQPHLVTWDGTASPVLRTPPTTDATSFAGGDAWTLATNGQRIIATSKLRTTNNVVYSDDGGATWSQFAAALPDDGTDFVRTAVTYDPAFGRFVLVARKLNPSTSKIYVSEDGQTWTLVATLTDGALTNVRAWNGCLVAAARVSDTAFERATVTCSFDGGVTWEQTSASLDANVDVATAIIVESPKQVLWMRRAPATPSVVLIPSGIWGT